MNSSSDLPTIKKTKLENKINCIEKIPNQVNGLQNSSKTEKTLLKDVSGLDVEFNECLSENSCNSKKLEVNCEKSNEDTEDIKNKKFYVKGKEYWQNVEPTVDGMLGGLAHVSGVDIAESTKFLKQFVKSPVAQTNTNYALDCGAGIGRITKKLLLPIFKNVDMVEVNEKFLQAAPSFIAEEAHRVGKYICCGLQDFIPEFSKYDLIWCQWVLGHLTDDDLVSFFKRCKSALKPNGLICFKENVATSSEFDAKDSSYTRSRQHFIDLVTLAGLEVLKETRQKSFPTDLYQVRMFALS